MREAKPQQKSIAVLEFSFSIDISLFLKILMQMKTPFIPIRNWLIILQPLIYHGMTFSVGTQLKITVINNDNIDRLINQLRTYSKISLQNYSKAVSEYRCL